MPPFPIRPDLERQRQKEAVDEEVYEIERMWRKAINYKKLDFLKITARSSNVKSELVNKGYIVKRVYEYNCIGQERIMWIITN